VAAKIALLWTAVAGLAASLVGIPGLSGEGSSQLLLVLGAIVALSLSRASRRP
jgi:hypothetical protein